MNSHPLAALRRVQFALLLTLAIVLCGRPSASAADLSLYSIGKARFYRQSGPVPGNAPALEELAFQSVIYQSAPDTIGAALLTGPNGVFDVIANNSDDPRLLENRSGYSGQSELDTGHPSGTYSFQMFTDAGGQINASLALSGDAYPTAPALNNYAAAQDIDATKPFVLQWTKPAQLDAADLVTVSIWSDGVLIFSSPMPWEPGVLNGTATSFSIPANTLPKTGELTAQIQFINVVARDTQSIAGAVGLSAYSAGTTFPLLVHGGGGGGGDITPPILTSVQPATPASGVSSTAPVVFTFSEAMLPQQEIHWFGPPNPANFVYSWSADGRKLTSTYPGGFPASTTITWQLTASGFADLAGNSLIGGNLAGAFTTGTGGTTNPCTGGSQGQINSFAVLRSENFTQASTAAPVLETDVAGVNPPASFLAAFSPSGLTPTAVELLIPGGQRKTLSSTFGHYFLLDSFATEAALLSAYANGTYTGEITTSGGKSSQSVSLINGPNTPHNSNYDPAQAINPASPFVLAWDPLIGATANDRLDIAIFDLNGAEIFRLPDECSTPPKPLPTSASSVILPANLLQPATTYSVELTFTRVSDVKSNAAPAYVMFGGFAKTTRFNIKTIGSGNPNNVPVITGYRVAADGHFEVDVTASAGRTIKLNASDFSTPFTTVGSSVAPASGHLTVRDTRLADLKSQFYRVRSE